MKFTALQTVKNNELVLFNVVRKTLEESGMIGVVINGRIFLTFRKKIYSLQNAFKKVSRRGGKCVKKLFNQLEFGRPYSFKIYYNEVDAIKLKNDNEKVKDQKRLVENSLVEETAKRLRVEEKLTRALEKAEKKGSYYKKLFKRLAKKVIRDQNKKGRGPAKKTKFNDYSMQKATDKDKKRIKGTMSNYTGLPMDGCFCCNQG